MFILVRDEDATTVAAAVSAFADEQGLEPVDLEAQAQNPLAVLGLINGPRAMISEGGGQVFVAGLETLDVAEADEWGSHLSTACEAEVIAIDVSDEGLRIYVFDGGELDEEIEVPLDPKGRTFAPQLVDLTDSEEGKRELEAGVVATGIQELLPAMLRCLGVDVGALAGEDAIALMFHDPLPDDEAEGEPALVVQPLTAAQLEGVVGGAVASPHGNVFGVVLASAESITGLHLELAGDALALMLIDRVEVNVRLRGGHEQEQLVFNGASIDLPDAFLESVPAAPPALDMTDLFSTMQRLMSANDAQVLNTLTVNVSGIGTSAGEGELVLRVSPLGEASAVAAGETGIPVRIRD